MSHYSNSPGIHLTIGENIMKHTIPKYLLLFVLLLALVSCTTPKTAGIKPLEPENGGKTTNLQPVLKWSAADDHDGTYDLVIFQSIKDDQFGKNERLVEVYFRKGLPGGDHPNHQLEISLNPDKQYRWTVRPRIGGKFGEWAKLETRVFTGVSYHRRVRPFYFFTPDE